MSDIKTWGRKLDPHSRMRLEDGLPAAGIEVTVRLTQPEAPAGQVEQAGLELHAQVGDILVGHVSSEADLKKIAELDCVQEVQLSRPLYTEEPDTPEEESRDE